MNAHMGLLVDSVMDRLRATHTQDAEAAASTAAAAAAASATRGCAERLGTAHTPAQRPTSNLNTLFCKRH